MDWVYFFNNCAEGQKEKISAEEMYWMVAEIQMHLIFTDVGCKVREILPNIREKRNLKYPYDYNANDTKFMFSKKERDHLVTHSNESFLAGLKILNVRLCVPDIQAYFIADYTRSAIASLLAPSSRYKNITNSVTIYEELLGSGNDEAPVLRSQWGLDENSLNQEIDQLVDNNLTKVELPALPYAPEKNLKLVESFIPQTEELFRQLRNENVRKTETDEYEKLIAKTKKQLADALSPKGFIRKDIIHLCLNPDTGLGLEATDGLLKHIVEHFKENISMISTHPDPTPLEKQISDLKTKFANIKRSSEAAKSGIKAWIRKFFSQLRGNINSHPYSPELLRRINRAVRVVRGIENEIRSFIQQNTAARVHSQYMETMSEAFDQFRKEVIRPAIQTTELAMEQANDVRIRCEENMKQYRCGDWIAHTTRMVGGDAETRSRMRKVLSENIEVRDMFLKPLLGVGIVHGKTRLTANRFLSASPRTILETVRSMMGTKLTPYLEFLNDGWHCSVFASLLKKECAQILDKSYLPSIDYHRSTGNGECVWLIIPKNMILPQPFGTKFSGHATETLEGRDPLTISLVSAVYGVPPNLLKQIPNYFKAYTDHLGDNLPLGEKDPNKFALHVIRDGCRFKEPYIPSDLNVDDKLRGDIIHIFRKFSVLNGQKVYKGIRNFPLDENEWQTIPDSELRDIDTELVERLISEVLAGRVPEAYILEASKNGYSWLGNLYEERKYLT